MLGSRGWFVRRVPATIVFSLLVATSPSALAAGDESDERQMQAQSLYEQALKLEGSDPKAALGTLRVSYETHTNFRVLYNIGRICVKLGDKECAVRSLEQYLKDGGTDVPAKRRKEVEAELKGLSSTKSGTTLTIKSSLSGGFVKVDGSVVGRTPLSQPIRVTAGNHKVVLVANGNVIERSVQVAAGSSATVELESKEGEPPPPQAPAPAPPAPAPAPPAPAPVAAAPPKPSPAPEDHAPEPAPPKPGETKRGFPVVPWIVAGAFATGTVVTGIQTAGASSTYEALKDQYPVSRESLDDARTKGRNLLLLTSALGAVTVVSVGVAGYFTFFRRDATPREKTVGIAVGPNGISISGRLP